jgi:hypothetical protein
MISRLAFDAELAHAIRVRGLTLTEVARRANLSPATVSSALSGHPVNLTTALRLTRVVSACPVVPELERWGRDPYRRPSAVDSPADPAPSTLLTSAESEEVGLEHLSARMAGSAKRTTGDDAAAAAASEGDGTVPLRALDATARPATARAGRRRVG